MRELLIYSQDEHFNKKYNFKAGYEDCFLT